VTILEGRDRIGGRVSGLSMQAGPEINVVRFTNTIKQVTGSICVFSCRQVNVTALISTEDPTG